MTPTTSEHHQNTPSLDEGFLNMPSPFCEDFSLPPSSLTSKTPVVNPGSKLTSYLASFLHRFTYNHLSNPHSNDEDKDIDNESQGYERKPRRRHIHWADTPLPPSPPYTNWVLIVSLLLLLSVTVNAFLLFEGRERHYATVPHDAFQIKELGRNYTCFHRQKTDFYRVDRYERLDGMYDHYWRDLLGGSDGYVYTMSDGGVKEARLGMFHQLECLYQMRKAMRESGRGGGDEKGKGKRKDFVVVDHDGVETARGWEHCFDYLRQVVLCGADDTVEFSDGVGKGAWDSFGYGRRQCRDPKWLFDVTKCGRRGCKGSPFYHE
ncbi:uncharacterized protein N0V89_002693 [Didymosphaeria variabile]|uniref:Uncharacterized protein n=1 Tax=Didymosphaeria variabile TaxID=1932322 RepID=A0A9W8XT54_9PLEO|nr:uncharacterized protein N0V89_002693 [Didymosphaeria variabile]KAJ4358114.1 hypothetical protein N0V89_002693 [Didymosphaeria variabile]